MKELDYKNFKILFIKIVPVLAMNNLHILPEALHPHDQGPIPQECLLSLNLPSLWALLIPLPFDNQLSFPIWIWPSGQKFSVLTKGARTLASLFFALFSPTKD